MRASSSFDRAGLLQARRNAIMAKLPQGRRPRIHQMGYARVDAAPHLRPSGGAEAMQLFTSFDGRISRRTFWFGLLVFMALGLGLSLLALPLARDAGPTLRVVGFMLSLPLLYVHDDPAIHELENGSLGKDRMIASSGLAFFGVLAMSLSIAAARPQLLRGRRRTAERSG
jgi:uncharacterized membrane protein YhaH (DUF805 family)